MSTVTRRWIVVLTAVAVVFVAAAIRAGAIYVETSVAQRSGITGEASQADFEAFIAMIQTAYLYYELLPWLATAALLAGITALALAARRAQLAGSASATASREVSRSSSTSAGSAESIS